MSDMNGGRVVFVFDEDASYGLVQDIKSAGRMPTAGLRYVAAVTGPWRIFKVITFHDVRSLAPPLDSPGDPNTATTFNTDKLRKSIYKDHTAFVRIETDVADPSTLLAGIAAALNISVDDLEADVVVGDFDILVCLVDDDETNLGPMVLAIRGVTGVRRTVTLKVIDYASTSANAPNDGHRVEPADEPDE